MLADQSHTDFGQYDRVGIEICSRSSWHGVDRAPVMFKGEAACAIARVTAACWISTRPRVQFASAALGEYGFDVTAFTCG
jgi:hypothetical protein